MIDVAVIILTYNEERNVGQALSSVFGWARQVFVFDSFSTDRTLEIARSFDGCVVAQHRFEDYGKQRNAALALLPLETEWVFFLDADEWLPQEFKENVARVLSTNPRENGFYCNRRLLWMGDWIRRGYYPTWIVRLFRRGRAVCEARSVNEHLVIDGQVGFVDADFMHESQSGLGRWIEKHNQYADREAQLLLDRKATGNVDGLSPSLFGNQAQRKRWLRERVWNQLPPVARPFAYFGYRYVLRGGFLDGAAGFSYHFLQGLWFPLLIDLKYLELKRQTDRQTHR